MPFVQVKIDETIEEKRKKSESFKQIWEGSREEYRLIGEMISLRKPQKITQSQLAKLTGNKQQVISRIEKRENCPTLKTFCNLHFIQICDFVSYFVHLYYKTHYEKCPLPNRVAKLIDEDFIGRVMATFKANNILNLKASSERYGLVVYPKN